MRINDKILLTDDEIGDDHISTSDFTPIRDDAFDKSDEEKISIIQEHVKEIMLTLGLDLECLSLAIGTFAILDLLITKFSCK